MPEPRGASLGYSTACSMGRKGGNEGVTFFLASENLTRFGRRNKIVFMWASKLHAPVLYACARVCVSVCGL